MFYVNDFKISKDNKIHPDRANKNSFSVIITNKVKNRFSQYSITNAAKPLIHFASLFGAKLISYEKNKFVKIKLLSKLYSVLVIIIFIILSMVIRGPLTWHDTKSDVPLNILTRTYGILNIAEAVYSVFSVAFLNNEYYVELFKKFDDIDNNLGISKKVFGRRRFLSVLLVIFPILQTFLIFWWRRFDIQNIGSHLTFFLVMLQGSLVYFFVLNIYIKLLMLNIILMKKVKKTISKQKEFILQETISEQIIKVSKILILLSLVLKVKERS